MMKLLSTNEINNRLDVIRDWKFVNNSLEKDYTLKSFVDGLAFIIKVGIEAEKLDHHPNVLLHNWNKVRITISTHSKGGVTEKDFELAKQIDQINL